MLPILARATDGRSCLRAPDLSYERIPARKRHQAGGVVFELRPEALICDLKPRARHIAVWGCRRGTRSTLGMAVLDVGEFGREGAGKALGHDSCAGFHKVAFHGK